MSGHTPGPRRLCLFVHNDGSVTEPKRTCSTASYVRADIADEMLEALEMALPWVQDEVAVALAVEVAIAKAKGED